MPPDHAEECRTCRFWKPDANESGRCRRHPPQHLPAYVHLMVVSRDEQHADQTGEKMNDAAYMEALDEEAESFSAWGQPVTWQDDWCGEWRAKGEPPA